MSVNTDIRAVSLGIYTRYEELHAHTENNTGVFGSINTSANTLKNPFFDITGV